MIEINYTLHREDGEIQHVQTQSAQVPRVGELVTLDRDHSYQVVDVLWHIVDGEGGDRATVTACERGWHEHIHEVLKEWRRNNATE